MPARLRRAVVALGLIAGTPAGAAVLQADEAALRYYAAHGQAARVAAETARLQRLDPAWHVPTDLMATKAGREDEGPLWDLFRENRFDEIAKAIAQRQAAEPGWQPSDDLVLKMKARAVRTSIMANAKGGDWHAVVLAVKDTELAWAKDDAEVLWVIAEAYARENNCAEAFAIYHSILVDHEDPSERRATIEFAIPLIPMAMTEKLIQMGKVDASGASEFNAIAIDITRARISAFLHDEPAQEITEAELRRFEDAVRDSTAPNELGLVAWYGYKRHDYGLALEWFKLAIARGGDAMIAHGLAHTLDRLDRRREAEEVAYAWREPLVNNAILFIDLLGVDLTKEHPPFIEPERIERYAKVTMESESGEGAQALAWYAYNTCDYASALQWFGHATAWLPKEATVYGYALALQRLHRTRDFRDIVNRYDGLFPKVVGLVFDDGIRKPPPACEANPQAIQSVSVEPVNAADWTGRTMVDTLRPQKIARGDMRPIRVARASVPTPDMIAGGTSDGVTLRKRTDFPVAVPPENVLRFPSLPADTAEPPRERAAAPWPLVARRVPGVGPMPYERWGFTLAPGYDGTREASSPTAAERDAPAGTLWAVDQSLSDSGYHQASTGAVGALARPTPAKASGSEPSLVSGRS